MDDERLREVLAAIKGARLVYRPSMDDYLATGNQVELTTAEASELMRGELVRRVNSTGPFYKLTAVGLDKLGRLNERMYVNAMAPHGVTGG